MANTTVYPFGTEGQLPSSIGLINDLKTGGVDKALTAEQGKVIGESIYSCESFPSDDLVPLSSFDGKQIKANSEQIGKALSSVTTTSNSGYKAFRIQVKGAYSITYRKYNTANDYGCLFLDADDVVISGVTGTSSEPSMKTIGVPENAFYFIWSYNPSNEPDESLRVCEVRYLKTKELETKVDENKEDVDDLKDDIYGEPAATTKVVDFASENMGTISIDAGKLYNWSDTHNHRAYIIPVNGMSQVVIEAQESRSVYMFIANGLVPYGTIEGIVVASTYMATGCDGYVPASNSDYRMVVAAGTTATILLSKKAKYIYIQKNYSDATVDYTPESMTFSGFVRSGGRLDFITANGGPVSESISFVRGTIDMNGNLVADNNRVVSNPVPCNMGYMLNVNYPTYEIESVALYNNNGECVNRNMIVNPTTHARYFGSSVEFNGYFVRFVLLRRTGAVSLSDRIVKQFALLDDRRLHRLIPDNPKFAVFHRRRKALTNVVWKALGTISALPSKIDDYYKAGTHVGIPYSELGEHSKYVGQHVSIRTFLTALKNKRSAMYTECVNGDNPVSKYGISYHNWEASGPYYGTVCTGLTSYLLGLEPITSGQWGEGFIEGETQIAKGTQTNPYYVKSGNSWVVSDRETIKELIQPMDFIRTPGHCSVVTDIYLDEFGERQFLVWTEETSGNDPVAKCTPMSWDRVFERLETQAATTEGWMLLRFTDWSKCVENRFSADDVPMNWFDFPEDVEIDPDICTFAGDYVAFPIGPANDTANNNKAFLNIHRDGGRYDTLQIFSEAADESTDTPVAEVDISENSGTFIYNSTNIFADDAADKDDWIVVDLTQLNPALTHGKYKARVIKAGTATASGFTHFQMIDINFTVTGTSVSDMVCNYSSEEGTPYYMRRERLDGLGVGTRQRSIPDGETSSTEPRSWGINSTYKYVKVLVLADYGVVAKRINVYGQFNP